MNKEFATFQQQAYDYVRDQIINLGFKPGEYITDSQIAKILNISRTPAREAFQRLEKEGLLLTEPRRGWRVYTLSLEDIHEIFQLKIAIEGMMVAKAAECTDEALRKELADTMVAMKEAPDAEVWLEADVHLHNILFIMADNQRAERIIANLNDQWHRIRLGYVGMRGRTVQSIDEHENFVNSVLASQPDDAAKYMTIHLNRVRDDLINMVSKVLMPYNENGF